MKLVPELNKMIEPYSELDEFKRIDLRLFRNELKKPACQGCLDMLSSSQATARHKPRFQL